MATKAERMKALQDQLAAVEAEDDEELSVWVRKGDHETRLTGERARRWLKNNGYDEDDADDATAAEPLEEKGTKATKAVPPAKKTTAKVEKVAGAADDDAELEQDVPVAKPRREFF